MTYLSSKETGIEYQYLCIHDKHREAEKLRKKHNIPYEYLDTGLPIELSNHITYSNEHNEEDKNHIMEILTEYKDNIDKRSIKDYNLNEIEFISLQENLMYGALIQGLCTALNYDKSTIIKAIVTEYKEILKTKAESTESDNLLDAIFIYYRHNKNLKDHNIFSSLFDNMTFIIKELDIPRYALNRLENEVIQLNEHEEINNNTDTNNYKIIFKILKANKKNKKDKKP